MPIVLSGSLSLTGSVVASGNLTTTGTITAQTLVVQTITSSIVNMTGSNIFGSQITDRQTFTGSLNVTGSSANFSNQVCGLMGNFSCVGIGNVSPAQKLDISSGHVKLSDGYGLFYGTQTQVYASEAAKYVRFDIAGTSGVLYLSSSGNVGIGTTTPGSSLDVVGTIRTRTASGAASLFLQDGSATNKWEIGHITNNLYFYNYTLNTNSLYVSSSGYVGIRTTTPKSTLHVQQLTNDGTPSLGTARDGAVFTSNNGNYGLNITISPSGVSLIQSMRFDSQAIAYNLALQPTACNVGIGTESPSAKLHVYSGTSCTTAPTLFLSQFDGSGQGYGQITAQDKNHGVIFRGYPNNYTNYGVTAGDVVSFLEYGDDFRFYRKTDANDMQVQVQFLAGTIYARSTTVQSLSDIRTKENIRNSEEGLNVITCLRPVRFDFKNGYSDGKKNQLGFVAQEVEQVFPEAVSTMKTGNEKEECLKTVGPGALIPVLVKAIQEQQCTINLLKTCIGIV